MKLYKIFSRIAVVFLAAVVLTGCAGTENDKEANQISSTLSENSSENGESSGTMVAFRPVDCGVQSQEKYEYPFLGLELVLTEEMRKQMDNRNVFVFAQEDYTEDAAVSYAVLRFSETGEEQKQEEVMSVDILSWEEALIKIGAIGVYRKEMTEQLDALTACDIHKKIGESADGLYEYYLSISSGGNAEYSKELEHSLITICEMHELDMSFGYSAFSMDRLEGIATVGTFTTEDVFGKTYTQEIFSAYDLTLVNVMTTWCTYCVEEIPDLEKLRQEYEEKGIKLGVVVYVMDINTVIGRDEGALELAQRLAERSGVTFPLLIPDEGNLNGRLTGIESVPESFFVDNNGVIVSEPYLGARSQKAWGKIVEDELAKLEDKN